MLWQVSMCPTCRGTVRPACWIGSLAEAMLSQPRLLNQTSILIWLWHLGILIILDMGNVGDTSHISAFFWYGNSMEFGMYPTRYLWVLSHINPIHRLTYSHTMGNLISGSGVFWGQIWMSDPCLLQVHGPRFDFKVCLSRHCSAIWLWVNVNHPRHG